MYERVNVRINGLVCVYEWAHDAEVCVQLLGLPDRITSQGLRGWLRCLWGLGGLHNEALSRRLAARMASGRAALASAEDRAG